MVHSIWIILALTVVGSALLARRVPMARSLVWALCWVMLFLGVYAVLGTIEPQITAWKQTRRGGDVKAADGLGPKGGVPAMIAAQSNLSGAGMTIPMQSDGHFWVDATVNGQPVRFLIDSGASITALSQKTADMLGLIPDLMNRNLILSTANGEVTASRSTIPVMQIGTIQASDLPVAVSPALGEVNLLGMNFLNKLKSWRVEDGHMVLEPQ